MSNVILTSPEELKVLIMQAVRECMEKPAGATAGPELPKDGNYLTRAQVAEKLHISLPTLGEYTKEGKLRGYRIGRRVLYKEDEINTALSEIKTFGKKLRA